MVINMVHMNRCSFIKFMEINRFSDGSPIRPAAQRILEKLARLATLAEVPMKAVTENELEILGADGGFGMGPGTGEGLKLGFDGVEARSSSHEK
jgi:hypothetical protein